MESIKAIDDLYEDIIKKLGHNGQQENILQQLMKLNSNSTRVMFIYDLLNEYAVFPQFYSERKSSQRSEQHRKNGNVYFKNSNYMYAYQCYNMALLYAPVESDLVALAYGNRSAVLFRMKLFNECINDIQLAYKYNYPKNLIDKLNRRLKMCSTMNSTNVKDKSTSSSTKNYQTFLEKKSENKCYVSASASIEVKYTKQMGRHVIAKEDLDVGDVVAVEEPFVKLLSKNQYLIRCHYCFHTDYNLYPCDTCCYVMFCSKHCQTQAWKDFHSVECSIMTLLMKMKFPESMLLGVRMVVKAKSDYGAWNNFLQFVHREDSTRDVMKRGCIEVYSETGNNYVYDSKYYPSIHALVTNIEKLSIIDIFRISVTSAIFLYLLEQHTSFFKEERINKNDARKLTAGLLLQHTLSSYTNAHGLGLGIITKKNEILDRIKIGLGIYAFMSLFNHSCVSNVIASNDVNGTMTLVVLRPVKKGKQLFCNYRYHYATHSKQERQEFISRNYKFNCNCEACEDNWPLHFNLKRASKLSIVQQNFLDAATRDAATTQLIFQGNADIATSKYKELCKAASAFDEKAPCCELVIYQQLIQRCLFIFHGILPFQYNQLIE